MLRPSVGGLLLVSTLVCVGCGSSEGKDPVRTADMTVTGAQSASWSYTSEANVVRCSSDMPNSFAMTAYPATNRMNDGIDVNFTDYAGPGTYTFTATQMGTNSVTVYVGTQYEYHFPMGEVTDATCTLTVSTLDETGLLVSAGLVCSGLEAGMFSADYVIGATDQPEVGLSASFTCTLNQP